MPEPAYDMLLPTMCESELDALLAAERERCAKICDDLARENTTTRKGEGASLCAHRIRAIAGHG